MLISKNQLLASICKDSFADFVKHFWNVVIPEDLIWNWHMDVLCDELQELAERVFLGLPREHDLIINVPPGSSKSSICSVMFPAWIWTRMPQSRSICASYAHSLALNLSRLSRLVIKDDSYQALFPDITISKDQDTKGHFSNEKGGMRYCVGIGGSVTGFHGHFLIVDDPLDPNAAISEKELETANKWMTETLPTRKVDKAVAPLILIMQRLHQNDPTGMLLEKARESEGPDSIPIRHICLPAEVSKLVRPRSLRKRYIDGLLDPVRLSKSVLATYKPPNLSEFAYAGQFEQSPVPDGGGEFKTEKLTIDQPPVLRKFSAIVRYWDKAGSANKGCYTVGVLMGRDNADRIWILDVVRGQWEAFTREKILKQTAQADSSMLEGQRYKKKFLIGVEEEGGSGGKESAENTVRNLVGFNVVRDRPVGDKEKRANPFACQVNGSNVHLAIGAWNHSYIEELKYFPHSKNKDQVDASSGAFAMLAKPRKIVGALGR